MTLTQVGRHCKRFEAEKFAKKFRQCRITITKHDADVISFLSCELITLDLVTVSYKEGICRLKNDQVLNYSKVP